MANALANLFTDIANSIRSKTGSTDKMSPSEFPSQIDSIQGGGGGIPTGYKTVTFKNGDNVLFERLVLSGDDCPDPITQGRIETPTKESTVQYHYTHSGWTSVDGGTANSSILKNITEDKVVYSAYTTTTVKYTITYYDEDGVTVLHTEQVAYGSVPSYIPSKDGFAFIEWTPAPAVVTGNASYIARWTSVLASGTCGDSVRWSLSTDYALTISGNGAMYDYEGPADVPWNSYASQIVAVTILDGVTSVSDYAFYQHTSLVDVELADSVTHIGNRSFYRCSTLTSITLPDNIASIDSYAFGDCTNLTDVHISDIAVWCNINVNSYETHILYTGYGKTPRNLYINGVLATDIVIPNSVTNIKQYAFAYCSTLTSVTIPDSVTSIDYYAFAYCTGLESVAIANSVTSIGERAFDSCTSLTGVIIPNSVISIESCAFSSCPSLTSITIPDSVTSLGSSAFSSCTNLTSITIPDSVISIGNNLVGNTAYFKDANNWDNDVLYIGNHLIKAKESIAGAYSVKANVRTIAHLAFESCTSLTSVDIPNSIVAIGERAFYKCTGLTNINVSNSTYVSIDGVLFDNECTQLITYPAGKIATEFNIPDSVTSIKPYVFAYCSTLTSVTIPDSVISLDDHAFAYWTGLRSIIIPDNVINIGVYTFYQCTNLESITIGSGVTSISRYMFGYCSGLTSITIPDSVTSIGESAFYQCTGLASITIGSGVTSIDYQAFYYCSGLTSAIFVDKDGWSVVHRSSPSDPPKTIYASNLTTSNAAKLLRSTYSYYIWTKA